MDVTTIASTSQSLAPETQLVKRLRNQANMDVVFDNVCKLFANRQRARQDITIHTLKLTTKAAGYNYSHDQHVGVLTFLGSVGVGELERKDNKVVALRNIRYNIQSLGQAANNNKPAPTAVEPFRHAHGGQFKAMLTSRLKTPPPTVQRDQSRHAPLIQIAKPIKVAIDAGNGMPMTLELPLGADLVAFLAHIYSFSK